MVDWARLESELRRAAHRVILENISSRNPVLYDFPATECPSRCEPVNVAIFVGSFGATLHSFYHSSQLHFLVLIDTYFLMTFFFCTFRDVVDTWQTSIHERGPHRQSGSSTSSLCS